MTYYTRFTVSLPEKEAEAFKEVLAASDFEYTSRDRFHSNSEYGEFVRYLVCEQMMEESDE